MSMDGRTSKPRGPRTSDTVDIDEPMRDRLRKALDKSQLKQAVFGARLGRDQGLVAKIVGGTQKSLTRIEMETWARAGGVSADWIEFGDTVAPKIVPTERTPDGEIISEADVRRASAPPINYVPADGSKNTNRVRDLLTAQFLLPGGNFNPEEGRNLLLEVFFGSYSDGAPPLWKYDFRIDSCRVYVSTNASIVGTEEEKKVKSNEGGELRLKRTTNLPHRCAYHVDNPVSGQCLEGNYPEIEICLVKGSTQLGDRAWLKVFPQGLIVTMNTDQRKLKGRERNRVLEQWAKLKDDMFEDDGSLDLSETRFD